MLTHLIPTRDKIGNWVSMDLPGQPRPTVDAHSDHSELLGTTQGELKEGRKSSKGKGKGKKNVSFKKQKLLGRRSYRTLLLPSPLLSLQIPKKLPWRGRECSSNSLLLQDLECRQKLPFQQHRVLGTGNGRLQQSLNTVAVDSHCSVRTQSKKTPKLRHY